MRKINIIIVITLINFSLSCSKNLIIKDNDKMEKHLQEQQEVYVVRHDEIVYFFKENMYKMEDDTLFGEGQRITWGKKQKASFVKIAGSEIEHIELRNASAPGYLLSGIFIGGMVGLVIFYLGYSIVWGN